MLETLMKKALQQADEVEVYYAQNRIHSVMGEKDKLKAESMVDQGVGIRVQVDGKVGFAFTTDVDDEECIKQAVSIARCKKESMNLEFPCKDIPVVEGLYSQETADLSVEDSIAYLNDLLSCDSEDMKIGGSLEIREMKRAITNSSGLHVSETGTFADLSLAVEGHNFVSEDVCSRSFKNLNAEPLKEDLIKRAQKSPAKRIKRQIDTVILSPGAGSLLFSTLLCPAFCADNVLQKQSFLGNLEGQIIATEELVMRDDATLRGGLVSRSFDAEGSPSQQIPLIENGRLAGFLHNLKTAYIAGCESTGSAFRDYRNEPIVFPSNVTVTHARKIPLENLIDETKNGVLARGIIGAYSSDYITGDFSVTLDECSLIENGDIQRIENVSIGGNALDLLMSVECVSKEELQCGHFVMPSMKISGLKSWIRMEETP